MIFLRKIVTIPIQLI